jgi:hypothetical protein
MKPWMVSSKRKTLTTKQRELLTTACSCQELQPRNLPWEQHQWCKCYRGICSSQWCPWPALWGCQLWSSQECSELSGHVHFLLEMINNHNHHICFGVYAVEDSINVTIRFQLNGLAEDVFQMTTFSLDDTEVVNLIYILKLVRADGKIKWRMCLSITWLQVVMMGHPSPRPRSLMQMPCKHSLVMQYKPYSARDQTAAILHLPSVTGSRSWNIWFQPVCSNDRHFGWFQTNMTYNVALLVL